MLGKRVGFGKEPMRPHNLTLVMLGAGILWFGWFGFNAGLCPRRQRHCGLAWVNTLAATGAAMLGWLLVEKMRDGHPTTLGAASGVVAGLVAITPACSALTPVGSVVLGILAGAACAYAVGLKFRLGYDDSLDVVGVHLVGGLVGTIGVGFLASASAPAGVDGLFYGGGWTSSGDRRSERWRSSRLSFIATYVIGLALEKTIGFRLEREAEVAGIDLPGAR